ncbi:MAG: MFS transporter [Lachnospiraceae bacterium]|nr:MFS transporter [Lachnospiraceae bacterium]
MKTRSKTQNLLLMITLFLSTASIMGGGIISVIVSRLYELYDAWAVNLMLTGPGIAGLIACPIAGRLCDKMDKKTIMLTGYILYAFSAIGGAAVDNQIYMIIMRLLAAGICYGLTSTAAMGIITDCYPAENERGRIVGWYNAAMAIIGGIVMLAAGNLAVSNWKLAFAVNWFSIPLIIMIIFFIPSCPPIPHSIPNGAATKAKGTKGWYRKLVPLLISLFLTGFCYYTITGMIDLYVSGNQLGNSAFTGLLATAGSVGSFIACSLFGFTYSKLKDKTGIPSYILLSAGFFLLAFFPSSILALTVSTVMGLAWGNVYSYWWMRCTVVVPEEMAGTAIGITGTVNSICGFPVPYFLLFLKDTILHTENIAATFPVYGMILILVAAGAIIYTARQKQTA